METSIWCVLVLASVVAVGRGDVAVCLSVVLPTVRSAEVCMFSVDVMASTVVVIVVVVLEVALETWCEFTLVVDIG